MFNYSDLAEKTLAALTLGYERVGALDVLEEGFAWSGQFQIHGGVDHEPLVWLYFGSVNTSAGYGEWVYLASNGDVFSTEDETSADPVDPIFNVQL